MLDTIGPLITNVNSVISGERVLAVKVEVPTKDAFLLGGTIFIAMFLAGVCAILVTRKF
jgi:hypothetical protein